MRRYSVGDQPLFTRHAVEPVLANVLRLCIGVVRLVDELIRPQFDRVANGVELTIQFIVRIYGHTQKGDQEPRDRVQEKIVPKSVRQFRDLVFIGSPGLQRGG